MTGVSRTAQRRLAVCIAMFGLSGLVPAAHQPLTAVESQTLTVPAYDGLPVEEGYFAGADGARLFYRRVGTQSNPIVFLHGGPGLGIDDGGYDLEPLAAKGHSLLMLNERGAGRSEVITDKARLGMDAYVRDVEALRLHFGLDRFAVIGLSWGSAVAATYAAAHPTRVTRIVLLSPMPVTKASGDERSTHLMSMLTDADTKRMHEIDALWAVTADEGLPTLCRDSLLPVLRLYVTDPSHLNRTRGNLCGYAPDALRNRDAVGDATVASLGEWDFRPMLRTIRMPTLVVDGEQTNAPLDDVRQWARSLRNGRLLLIPNAGHMNWLDQPEAVVTAFDAFFRGRWPGGSVG